jgi:hypothetical protein
MSLHSQFYEIFFHDEIFQTNFICIFSFAIAGFACGKFKSTGICVFLFASKLVGCILRVDFESIYTLELIYKLVFFINIFLRFIKIHNTFEQTTISMKKKLK